MDRITFAIDKDLDEKFRKVIAERKGLHKGVIGEALEEAIRDWIKDEKKRRRSR